MKIGKKAYKALRKEYPDMKDVQISLMVSKGTSIMSKMKGGKTPGYEAIEYLYLHHGYETLYLEAARVKARNEKTRMANQAIARVKKKRNPLTDLSTRMRWWVGVPT